MFISDFDDTVNNFIEKSKQYKSSEASWGHCYKAFKEIRLQYPNVPFCQLNKQIKQFLCLHLGFYLASWGMYRGDTLIRQFDYTVHEEAIQLLFKPEYNKLWNATIDNLDSDLIGQLCVEMGKVYEEEKKKRSRNNFKKPTTTLVTKILMGTMACTPAYDQYFYEGIREYIKSNTVIFKIHNFDTNQINKQKITNSILFLKDLWKNNIKTNINEYPEMKLIDMYFWEKGYNKDLVKKQKK